MIHHTPPTALFPLLCLGLLPLAACTSTSDFPSLQPRPIESIARQPERDATPPVRAVDPALEKQVATLDALLRADGTEWDAGVATARTAVGRARGARVGEESWVVAQQAVSRLESLRQATAAHLDSVAQLRLAQAQSATPADATRLDALWARGVAQVESQNSVFTTLAGSLPTG